MAGGRESRKKQPSEEGTFELGCEKQKPTPGRSERKAPGKWNSRCKGPEAGPASKKGSHMNGKKASARWGWVSKQKPGCVDFILVQQEDTRRSQAEQ